MRSPPTELAARVWSRTVRVRVLPLAERLWGSSPSPTLRTRRLFSGKMVLDVSRSNAHRELYLEGERFLPEAGLVASLVQPRRPAIDIGANIGYYVLLIRSAGASAVIAIEPDRDNMVDLRRVVDSNGFDDVALIAAAVGDQPGVTRFQPGLNGAVDDAGEIEVKVVTIDQIAPADVGFIKIDVEGYEGPVLAGARDVLERARPNLFVEMHPQLVSDPHAMDDIIADLRDRYPNVSLYGNPRHRRGLRGLVQRFQTPVLPELDAPDRDKPFWLVARS